MPTPPHSERAATYGDYVVEVADGKVNRSGVKSGESDMKLDATATPDYQLPVPVSS